MKLRLKKQNRYKSFTLVELLIVIIIISVLASVGVGHYRKGVVKAKAGRAKHAIALIVEAEKIYKIDRGYYLTVVADAGEATIGTAVTGMNLAIVDNDTDFTYSVTAAGVVSASNTAAIGSCTAGTQITFDLFTNVVNVPACYE